MILAFFAFGFGRVNLVGGDGCLRGFFFSLRFSDVFRVVKKNLSLL
jgi:hypothetical protein